jgi:predicted ATP-grasp superfamily ATP-dependent carboligase
LRILVYEHFTAQGSGAPGHLLAEGGAMLAALATDLAAAGHEISIVLGPGPLPPCVDALHAVGVGIECIHPAGHGEALRRALEDGDASRRARSNGEAFRRALAHVDAVWIIAPETGRCLESLTRAALAAARRVLGSLPDAIGIAASKLRTLERLREAGIPAVPAAALTAPRWEEGCRHLPRGVYGRSARSRESDGRARAARAPVLPAQAMQWEFPLVVKPDDGVGCEGVGLVRAPVELGPAWHRARKHSRSVVVQPYVTGAPASVSLLVAAGGRALPLALQRQHVETGAEFAYHGGEVPLASLQAEGAKEAARAACEALPGLAGLVGVDLILTSAGPIVLEVNPRLTTSYLGLRQITRANLAALALRALEGGLPPRVSLRGAVQFTSAGQVSWLEPREDADRGRERAPQLAGQNH